MQLVIAIFVAVIIYTAQRKLYKRLWDKALKIRIDFRDAYVECGAQSALTEVIDNAKFLPLPVFHVKFATDRSFAFQDYENASVTDSYHRNDVFSVMGNQRITRTLSFYAGRRGLYFISGIDVIAKDFFMTTGFARHIQNQTELYVFPKKYSDSRFNCLCNTLMGDMETGRSLLEDVYTFRGIRDYDRTDSMSRINWKATARTGDLMVNVYSHTSEQKVKILLNLETNVMFKVSYLQEVSIALASSAAEYFLRQHIPVIMESNGTDMITGEPGMVEAGASLNHMISIDKYLARLKENAGIDAFMDLVNRELAGGEKDVAYVIISSYCKEDLLVKLDYLVHAGVAVNMVVPYYDIQNMEAARAYVHGWEVRLDEA